uniref:non-muscle caldesmon-like n=1 Tax=Gasterosteus aculeatus aculeatus TaxID=481459 RepID=UPI001A996363|nr:non-muscle caldesmon-like [Gasterosteus aculeatus aculeatus]
MSESIRRKSSSRQLLQNLISVTAERSQEDAEEAERERRRRARETQRGEGGGPSSRRDPGQGDGLTARSAELDVELKPRCNQEEDEGFSDWSHRLENRGEQEVQDFPRRPLTRRKPEPGVDGKRQKGEEEEEKEEEEGCEPERSSRSKEASSRPPEKMTCDREEVRMSYSSTVFLSQDTRPQHTDRTSYLLAGTMRPRRGACRVDGELEREEQKEEVQAALQRESTETQRSSRDEEDHEEELSFRREEEECQYLRGEQEEEEEEEEEHRMPDTVCFKIILLTLLTSTRDVQMFMVPQDETPQSHHDMLIDARYKRISWMESSRGEEARGSEEARSEEASRRSEEASKRSKEAKSEKGSRRSEEASKRSKEPMSEEASSRSEEAKREEASKRSKEAKSEEARRRSEEASRSEEARRQEASRRSEEASRRSEEARSEEASRSEEARSEEASRRSEEARSEEASRRSEEPRSEEARRRSAASLCCSSDGEESLNYAPMSPTFKKLLIQFYPDEVNSRVSTDGKCSIIERTESLRKSTSHIKKTPSPVVVSKIDKKLELYAQALEVSTKDGRPGAQTPTDLTSPAERVSSKKSLFEPGDTRRHNAPPGSPSKDADGLKVGVANLINQWVGGSEGGSRCSSSCRPAENFSGKRFKFVVTGHGKYEKVPVEDCREEAHCPPAGHFYEDL